MEDGSENNGRGVRGNLYGKMENEAYVRLPVRYVYIYDSGPLCLISSVYLTDRAASVMAVLVASLEDLEDEVLYESTVM